MNNYDIAVHKTAEELLIPIKVVRECYRAYWKYIRDIIESLPLSQREELSKEEFDKLNTVFNIPSLCKIYCTYEHYLEKRQKFKNKIEYHVKNKKGTSNVHGNLSDNG